MLVWIDESGCDCRNSIRKYGYSVYGVRSVWGTQYSAVAATWVQGIHYVFLAEGCINGDRLECFISHYLLQLFIFIGLLLFPPWCYNYSIFVRIWVRVNLFLGPFLRFRCWVALFQSIAPKDNFDSLFHVILYLHHILWTSNLSIYYSIIIQLQLDLLVTYDFLTNINIAKSEGLARFDHGLHQ